MYWISAAEFARRAGVDRSTICRALASGRVPGARRLGRQWAIPENATVTPVDPSLRPTAFRQELNSERGPVDCEAALAWEVGVRMPQTNSDAVEFEESDASATGAMPISSRARGFLMVLARCGNQDIAARITGFPSGDAAILLRHPDALAFLRHEQGKAIIEADRRAATATRSSTGVTRPVVMTSGKNHGRNLP